jgi:hypothetical protein
MGSGLMKVRAHGSGTWRQMPSKPRHAQRGGSSAGDRKVTERARIGTRNENGKGRETLKMAKRMRNVGDDEEEQEKEEDGRDVQREGVGSLRFAGIDWGRGAERRRGRKTRGYNSNGAWLFIFASPVR